MQHAEGKLYSDVESDRNTLYALSYSGELYGEYEQWRYIECKSD